MELTQQRLVRVVYHYPCPDGAFAALAAYLYFHKKPNIDLDFVPHATFKPLEVENNPHFTPNTEVYMYIPSISLLFCNLDIGIVLGCVGMQGGLLWAKGFCVKVGTKSQTNCAS